MIYFFIFSENQILANIYTKSEHPTVQWNHLGKSPNMTQQEFEASEKTRADGEQIQEQNLLQHQFSIQRIFMSFPTPQ